jgi:hypothetical protein
VRPGKGRQSPQVRLKESQTRRGLVSAPRPRVHVPSHLSFLSCSITTCIELVVISRILKSLQSCSGASSRARTLGAPTHKWKTLGNEPLALACPSSPRQPNDALYRQRSGSKDTKIKVLCHITVHYLFLVRFRPNITRFFSKHGS